MSAQTVNKAATELLIIVAIFLVLLLVGVNIQNYLNPKKVLGVETQANPEEIFWKEFLTKNPNYIPGWIELGETKKIGEIDPNYITP